MTLSGALVLIVIWYGVMGLLCTLVAAKNGSLRATQQERFGDRQFSMAGLVLFIFVFWPYLIYRNYRYPEKFKEFYDETPD